MTFGENLQFLLEERDITQKDFASMLNIAKTTLNGYIKSNHEPDFETRLNELGYDCHDETNNPAFRFFLAG